MRPILQSRLLRQQRATKAPFVNKTGPVVPEAFCRRECRYRPLELTPRVHVVDRRNPVRSGGPPFVSRAIIDFRGGLASAARARANLSPICRLPVAFAVAAIVEAWSRSS